MKDRVVTTSAQFYADDGIIHGHKQHDIQHGIDILTATFARMGLQMYATKT
jgi:hypothetical protein